jgi:hypothetical protein
VHERTEQSLNNSLLNTLDQQVLTRATGMTNYSTHLLESNSHRVENDRKERTRESRRWLEGQIRTRMADALQSAERGLAMSTEKQRLSEAEVEERLARVATLREELSTLTRYGTPSSCGSPCTDDALNP